MVDQANWWEGKHKYVDREGRQIFVYEGNVSAGATPGYNTKLIKTGNYRSYWDFLDPSNHGSVRNSYFSLAVLCNAFAKPGA